MPWGACIPSVALPFYRFQPRLKNGKAPTTASSCPPPAICTAASLLPLTFPLQVKQQGFHDRLKQEFDIVEGYDTEASVAFIEVRAPPPPPPHPGATSAAFLYLTSPPTHPPLTSLRPRHQGIGGLDPMPFPPFRSSCVGGRT